MTLGEQVVAWFKEHITPDLTDEQAAVLRRLYDGPGASDALARTRV